MYSLAYIFTTNGREERYSHLNYESLFWTFSNCSHTSWASALNIRMKKKIEQNYKPLQHFYHSKFNFVKHGLSHLPKSWKQSHTHTHTHTHTLHHTNLFCSISRDCSSIKPSSFFAESPSLLSNPFDRNL